MKDIPGAYDGPVFCRKNCMTKMFVF